MKRNYMAYMMILLLLMMAGCGRIEEVEDGVTIDQNVPPAANCVNLNENSYGCYGSDKVFFGKRIVEGIWSVYTQSNLQNIGNETFYDRYQHGYDFREDGSAFQRQQSETYIYFREWGVDDAGTNLALSDGNTYVYGSVFANDSNCLQVQQNGETVKLCQEFFVNQSNENSAGYFGSDVKFGNLTNYNFVATGVWTIGPYDDSNTGGETTVTLNEDGSTSGEGEWGVSADGKVMSIDGTGYLVYQYLKGSQSNCIAVFELSGGIITTTTWKLCRTGSAP